MRYVTSMMRRVITFLGNLPAGRYNDLFDRWQTSAGKTGEDTPVQCIRVRHRATGGT